MDEAQRAKAVAGNPTALLPPLPGKFCELPRCFLKQGRKKDGRTTAIFPSRIVPFVDVTERTVRSCVPRRKSLGLLKPV